MVIVLGERGRSDRRSDRGGKDWSEFHVEVFRWRAWMESCADGATDGESGRGRQTIRRSIQTAIPTIMGFGRDTAKKSQRLGNKPAGSKV
jgi:hypothetical protein